MAEFAAGIDGGGTKTALVCRDLKGNTIDERRFGAFNLNGIGRENFESLIEEITAYLRALGSCCAVCIGAAGNSNPQMWQMIAATFQRAGIRQWKLVGDHEIALYGALEGEAGLCLIAGTGTICCGRDRSGRILRLGGWGHLIGDGGSAYALGRDAFAAAARQLDGLGPGTSLTERIMEAFRLTSREDMIAYVYQGGKSRIADAASLVEQAFVAGDTLAGEILKKNVQELVELTVATAERLSLQNVLVALTGGVLTHNHVMRCLFTHKLATVRPDLQCIDPKQDAAVGAVLLALSEIAMGGNS
ncbi:MAG: hypothetical protein K2P15_01290 [Oscillospiraceae bacterium]|nr:hypothetical protein [Oscillospiraceae bacterium]